MSQESAHAMLQRIEMVKGDITKQSIAAIVNAANESLLGGGGVDGAIHRGAGPELLVECRKIGGCPTGEARITKAYNLKSRFIIHTVGPIWRGGNQNEENLLASCYKNSLKLAHKNKLATLAFPSISTGVYGFPIKTACRIALKEVQRFLLEHSQIQKIVFVCFSDNDRDVYFEAFKEMNRGE